MLLQVLSFLYILRLTLCESRVHPEWFYHFRLVQFIIICQNGIVNFCKDSMDIHDFFQ